MDSRGGPFYGAPIKMVDAPFEYAYIFAGGEIGVSPKEKQFQFLASVKDKRFLELQKITGAYQGVQKLNRNQLLDAFHIWCAEHNGCDFFSTLDFKLIKVLERQRVCSSVCLVRPSELLQWWESGGRVERA